MVEQYNVLCVKWGKKYNADYVNKLYHMVERNLTLPHRFICFTDDSQGLESGIDFFPIPRQDLSYWWTKLTIFEKKLYDISGVGLFLDLDIIIINNIDDLFLIDHNDSFKGVLNNELFCGFYDWVDNYNYGTAVFRYQIGNHSNILYNFLQKIDDGKLCKKEEWDDYLQSHQKIVYYDENNNLLPGDQEWISQQVYPREELRNHVFPREWFQSYKYHLFFRPFRKAGWKNLKTYLADGEFTPPKECKIVLFHGTPKPHEVNHRWVNQHWK